MTSAHLIFIPAVLVVGIVLGFILGSRSARDAMLAQKRRDEQRRQAREERARRRAAREEIDKTEDAETKEASEN